MEKIRNVLWRYSNFNVGRPARMPGNHAGLPQIKKIAAQAVAKNRKGKQSTVKEFVCPLSIHHPLLHEGVAFPRVFPEAHVRRVFSMTMTYSPSKKKEKEKKTKGK